MIPQDKNFVSYVESRVQENSELYARFHLGVFHSGQALTVANALRRTLLSEIPALVVTHIQIEGVNHEFATLPSLHESILNVLLNIKRLVLCYKSDKKFDNLDFPIEREFTAYIDAKGPGIITAGDIKFPPYISPILPSHHIATLNSSGSFQSNLTIQIINPFENLKNPGRQNLQLDYQPRSFLGKESKILSLDITPKPVRQVNFGIHKVLTGQNEEYISLEIWTDGSIDPTQALNYSLEKLTKLFYTFTSLNKKNIYPILE